MQTQDVIAVEGQQQNSSKVIRVAVAGATGFAGQELIRLLSRHPNVAITAATGSQATSTPRTLPSLAKIWNGTVVPLNVDAFEADAVFLALPEAGNFTLDELHAGFKACLAANAKLVTSSLDPKLVLERLLIGLLSKPAR